MSPLCRRLCGFINLLSCHLAQAAEAGCREKVRVTPEMTLAHMTQLIMPQHANSLGITFGGQVRTPLYLLLRSWVSIHTCSP